MPPSVMHSRGSSHSEIFLMPNLNPAGSNLNHSSLACLCVEGEESSLPLPSRGPCTDSLAPTSTSFNDENESEAGAGRAGEGGREVMEQHWPSPPGRLFRRSTKGPGFNPAPASHFPRLSLTPLSLPRDLLSSEATFSP